MRERREILIEFVGLFMEGGVSGEGGAFWLRHLLRIDRVVRSRVAFFYGGDCYPHVPFSARECHSLLVYAGLS